MPSIRKILHGIKNHFHRKTVYLTFDDGPSEYTEALLRVLKKHGVKASFFVTGSCPEYVSMIKKESDEGHTVGAHCYSHDYSAVYADESAYFADLEKIQSVIKEQTGRETTFVRVPGGSSNTVSIEYKNGLMTKITEALTEKGYIFFDWNATGKDSGDRSPETVLENSEQGIMNNDPVILLLHDSKPATPEIVDELIKRGLKKHYRFLPLDKSSPTVHHRIAN